MKEVLVNQKQISCGEQDDHPLVYYTIGKEGFVNKLAAILALNFKAHKGTRNNYKHQLSLIKSKMDIIDVKKNIFFMTDIFYTSFKD